MLCRALGLSSNEDILNYFGEDERILATLEKDTTKNTEEGLLEVYRKLRPGEPPTVESATSQLNMLFFDPRRYDLSRFGRYKMNKKLSLARRIMNHIAAENVVAPLTGELLIEKDAKITRQLAEAADNAGVNVVVLNVEGKKVKVITNGCVDAQASSPSMSRSAASTSAAPLRRSGRSSTPLRTWKSRRSCCAATTTSSSAAPSP